MSELLTPQKDYDQRPTTGYTLRISQLPGGRPEIFASIQGEGPSSGRPSVFLRLAYCNLRCSWCDTKYTWDWQRFDPQREVREHSVAEVDSALNALEPDNLVVTGGEPLLQQDNLVGLFERQKARGRRIEVETNATVLPSHRILELVDQWNVSPKLGNSGEAVSRRLVPSALDAFRNNERAFFKLVIQTQADVGEADKLVEDLNISSERIFLMPEATDAKTLRERNGWLSAICSKRGLRLSPRLHVEKWDGARGR